MSENATGARRDGRKPARTRTVTKIAGLGVVTGALVVAGLQLPAVAAPTNVLQAVDVQVSGDGTLTSIDSTLVSQEADGSVSDDEVSHDPSKTGKQLPVRVLTSYRYADSSGTDLTDLEGVDGRVYIDVTVQNTTVEPQLLSYNSDAQNKTAPALVGTPLTVVASANLGDSNLGDVVVGEPGTEERVTNGVVSRDTGGDARVQWATMLAPPRLAPSATFTLVQEVEDFEPPTFDISVQPGLVTDTSVGQLVDSAFTDDNGTRELTTSTIALLSSVGSVLTDASTVLAKVEEQLDDSAGDLGSKTISDLESSATFVTSALGGLSSDLDSLDSSIAGSLSSSSDAAVQQLGSSFTEVKDKVLGDVDSYEPPKATPSPTGCATVTPQGSNQSTVYAQLLDVQAQLKQLGAATAGCQQEIVDSLRATVGTDADTCTTPSALGALSCATGAIADAGTSLGMLQTDITSIFERDRLDVFSKNYGLVLHGTADNQPTDGGLDEIRQIVNGLVASGGSGNGDELEDLQEQLETIEGQLSDVNAGLESIRGTAAAQVDLLSRDDDGAADQAAEIAGLICALPEADERDDASELLSGVSCDELANADLTDDSSVRGKLAATTAAWQDVLDDVSVSVDEGGEDSFADFLEGLISDVQNLLDQLEGLINGSGNIAELDSILDDIYEDQPQEPAANGDPRPDLPAQITELDRTFGEFVTNQTRVQDKVDAAFKMLDDGFGGQVDLVDKARVDINTARNQAETRTGGLFGRFTRSLDTVGQGIVDDGAESIDAQKDALDAEASDFERGLTGTVNQAIDRIGSQVGAANGELASSETQLVADLKAILVNIGTPEENGSGLLGTIFTGARSTGASNEQIVDASQLSDAFSRVRGTSLDDLFLQQAQVRASLEAEESFGAFDLDLADSTRARTVFSFHIGQD